LMRRSSGFGLDEIGFRKKFSRCNAAPASWARWRYGPSGGR
jgi:hypothetical protein